MSTHRALIITTSHAELGDTQECTGVWMGCLATSYWLLHDAGVEVHVASMRGGRIPIDSRSLQAAGANAPDVERFIRDPGVQSALEKSPSIRQLDPSTYDVLVLPGGHGCLWDHAADKYLGRAIAGQLASDGLVATICHGAAGLIAANLAARGVLEKRCVTAFSLEEEKTVGLQSVVPLVIETELRRLGADFKCGAVFEPYVVRDRNLISGQNPASARSVVLALLDELSASGKRRRRLRSGRHEPAPLARAAAIRR